jgi:small-conductance mechanosensitive channel
MPTADLGIPVLAQASAEAHWIPAAIALAVSGGLAYAVDRAFQRRGNRLAGALVRGELSPVVDTRLRFIRRVVVAGIVLVGVALALNQFRGLDRLATSLLASGAIAAAIVGFAARQTLANFVAGIMLAVTQPLRIGDWVTFEDAYGVVEDVRLNYTVLRTPGEQRIVIPNERLAGGVLRNDTLAVGAVGLDVSVWIAADADIDAAMRAIAHTTGATASVAEATPEGIRLSVSGDRVAPGDRGAREAELRADCLRGLRDGGLLPSATA